jgi:hypothetical protein
LTKLPRGIGRAGSGAAVGIAEAVTGFAGTGAAGARTPSGAGRGRIGSLPMFDSVVSKELLGVIAIGETILKSAR